MNEKPLDSDQQAACDMILQYAQKEPANRETHGVFVTGPAGTGKTLLILTLVSRLREVGINPLVVAPTGMASVHVSGQTIHSAFGLGPHYQGSLELLIEDPPRDRTMSLREPQVLVIDEVSMVTSDVFTALDYSLRHALETDLPFGGLMVAIFGDYGQLPPIRPNYPAKSPYRSAFAFSSPSWLDLAPTIFPLRKVHRSTKDSQQYLEVLSRIREGKLRPEDLEFLNDSVIISDNLKPENRQFYLNSGTPPPIFVTTSRRTAKSINDTAMDELPGEAFEYPAMDYFGDFGRMRDLPIDPHLRLKQGCRVLVTRNLPSLGVLNGDQGTVISLSPSTVTVHVDRTRESVELRSQRFDVIDAFERETELRRILKRERTLTLEQLPLLPGNAMTIHRAQGRTMDRVGIVLPKGGRKGTFAHGQLYTALSRVRQAEDVTLNRTLKADDFIFDDRVRPYLGLGYKQRGGRRKGAGRGRQFPGSTKTETCRVPMEIHKEIEEIIQNRWREYRQTLGDSNCSRK